MAQEILYLSTEKERSRLIPCEIHKLELYFTTEIETTENEEKNAPVFHTLWFLSLW